MPRSPKDTRIYKEVTTGLKLLEIEEEEDLKELLMPRWWEPLLPALLLCFSLGLLTTIIKMMPSRNELIYYFSVAFTVGFVIVVVMCLEALIRKLRDLRRVLEWYHLRLQRLEKPGGDAPPPERKQADGAAEILPPHL